jgi:hypothetical protein
MRSAWTRRYVGYVYETMPEHGHWQITNPAADGTVELRYARNRAGRETFPDEIGWFSSASEAMLAAAMYDEAIAGIASMPHLPGFGRGARGMLAQQVGTATVGLKIGADAVGLLADSERGRQWFGYMLQPQSRHKGGAVLYVRTEGLDAAQVRVIDTAIMGEIFAIRRARGLNGFTAPVSVDELDSWLTARDEPDQTPVSAIARP